jgi:hypothetical protein
VEVKTREATDDLTSDSVTLRRSLLDPMSFTARAALGRLRASVDAWSAAGLQAARRISGRSRGLTVALAVVAVRRRLQDHPGGGVRLQDQAVGTGQDRGQRQRRQVTAQRRRARRRGVGEQIGNALPLVVDLVLDGGLRCRRMSRGDGGCRR